MLFEREKHLASLTGLLKDACASSGRLLFLGGEAGIGKTSLAMSFLESVPGGVSIRQGSCDNVTTPEALGPFIEAVPEIVADEETGSRHEAFRKLKDLLSDGPAVLLLEDVHWADEATLELLRILGRRIDTMPLLGIATFRSDEVDAHHALSLVLGDLATTRAVVRLQVPALSVRGVQKLLSAAGSQIDAVDLHAGTDGNPFYVTEVLAADTENVPETVRDAVLARTSRLSDDGQQVLDAMAVLGGRVDLDLLVTVAGVTVGAVDECVSSGVLVSDGDWLSIRHELARLAIEGTIAHSARVELHARSYAELVRRGSTDHRRLAHHAAGCSDREAVSLHAPRAANLASARGAHREAAAECRLALRWLEQDSPARAEVLEQLSFELYVTDQHEEALDVQRGLLGIRQRYGDTVAAGSSMRWISRLAGILARNEESERHAVMAVESLEDTPGHELAMAYSNLGQLRVLFDDFDGSDEWNGRALALAKEFGDREVQSHALNNRGVVLAGKGRVNLGVSALRESLDIALTDGMQDHAARAYNNLADILFEDRRYAVAEDILRESVAYCADRDLEYFRLCQLGVLARTLAERGAWDDVERHASEVLESPHSVASSRVPAATAAGVVLARRGVDVADLLDDALEVALSTAEPIPVAMVAVARAEAAWIAGRQEIVEEIDRVWAANERNPRPWRTGELAWWLHVAGDQRPLPGPAAEPFALMLSGEHRAASDLWQDLGSPFWSARALAMSEEVNEVREAIRALKELGALGVRDAILRDRRGAGQPMPRLARQSGFAREVGLTAREHEVLLLLVQGLSNAEIGEKLRVSTKTAGHHVSAVLRKLDAPSRARAVVAARQQGLVPVTR